MLDCITIGDIKLDTFVAVPDASVMCELKNPECRMCIDYGRKIPTSAFVTQIAGSAPNVAIGLTKLGLSTAVVSAMGEDDTHALALHFLKRHRVASSFVTATPGFRSPAAVVLNFQGESTQLVDQGRREYSLPSPFPATRAVHLSELGDGYVSLFTELIAAKKEHAFLLSFNPGVVQIQERTKAFLDLLKVVDMLFVNTDEARKITGVADDVSPSDLLLKLHALGPMTVIMTDGKNGAYASIDGTHYHAPMFPAHRVEETGAGDAFATGFLGARLFGHDLAEALTLGSIEAASVIEHVGPTQGLLDLETIAVRHTTTPFAVTTI